MARGGLSTTGANIHVPHQSHEGSQTYVIIPPGPLSSDTFKYWIVDHVERFSDVAGRHVIRMSDTPQKRSELARRLQTAGCDVNLKGNDWMTAGDFTPPPEPGNGLPLGKRQPSTIKRVGVRLDARYHGRSGTNGQLEIVNHGPEDVFGLDVALPDDLHGLILQTAELPLRRLPAGKSLTLVCAKSMQLSSTAFDLIVTGRTTDGTILREELYVDLGA